MLIQKVYSLQEMRRQLKEREEHLMGYVAKYGEKVTVDGIQLHQLDILKKNYQTLVAILGEEGNQNVNNFSLHLIITISSGYIKYNKIDEAKAILKKTELYSGSQMTHIDPILLASCLNNLSNIQKLKGKYHKSLKHSLKALEIMQNHM